MMFIKSSLTLILVISRVNALAILAASKDDLNARTPTLTTSHRLALRAADTADDLMNGGCKAMTVVFARGTTETGNIGSVAGPPLMTALNKVMGADKVAMQGVAYPADIPGFLAGGDKAGSATMMGLVDMAMSKCPDTKVVMVGYSQGGQLVHNAAIMMPPATMAKVSSVLIFGDPVSNKPVQGAEAKTKVICHAGDNICAQGDLILVPHLTYGGDAMTAATYIADMAK